MKYFKIIIDKEVKGAVSSFNFFIENNGKLISSTDSLGQFVEYEGLLYRDYWMPPIPNNTRHYFNALISEISSEDYFAYVKAKQKNEQIIEDEPEEIIPEPVTIPIDENEEQDSMLAYIRTSKIAEMSYECRQAIETGFDITLRNEVHHFSLDTQDQLNLMTLSTMVQTSNEIPYHADGEPVIFYTAEEMQQIIAAANAHKIYHTTYHNALKSYINSLETIEEIAAVTYGMSIPEEYKTDVLKTLEQ